MTPERLAFELKTEYPELDIDIQDMTGGTQELFIESNYRSTLDEIQGTYGGYVQETGSMYLLRINEYDIP